MIILFISIAKDLFNHKITLASIIQYKDKPYFPDHQYSLFL